MPALNSQQFWKTDPNQMALPGLEAHAHPGAKLLSQGHRFEHDIDSSPGHPDNYHTLRAVHEGQEVGSLSWLGSQDEPEFGMHKGEIGMVDTHMGHERKGIATALYGLGRTLAKDRPEHSANRTGAGDMWAHSVSKKFGGKIPNLQ